MENTQNRGIVRKCAKHKLEMRKEAAQEWRLL